MLTMPNMEQDKENELGAFFETPDPLSEKRKKKRKILKRRSRFVFTDNRHPSSGIMSAVFGVISITTVIMAVVMTYKAGGTSPPRYAASVALAFFYGVAGLALGIYAKTRKNVFSFFPNTGIILCAIDMLLVAALFVLGL